MDLAYDHIQESALSPEDSAQNGKEIRADPAASTLNDDFQEAYKAISASPWGAKLGGFFGSVVKQVRLRLSFDTSSADCCRARVCTKRRNESSVMSARRQQKG